MKLSKENPDDYIDRVASSVWRVTLLSATFFALIYACLNGVQ